MLAERSTCERRCSDRHQRDLGGAQGERCDANVLVLGEIRKWIERARGSDPVKAEAIERWLRAVVEGLAHRILGVDGRIAEEFRREVIR